MNVVAGIFVFLIIVGTAYVLISPSVDLESIISFGDNAIEKLKNENSIFVGSDQDKIDDLLTDLDENGIKQKLGISVVTELIDSNGNKLPQKTNTLPIEFALKTDEGNLLDFANLRIGMIAILLDDSKIDVDVEYQLLVNGNVFDEGKFTANGETIDNKIILKTDDNFKPTLDLSFNSGDIPVIKKDNESVRNEFEVRLTRVYAIIGSGFDTKIAEWSGSFPVYSLSFDANANERVVRDHTGKAVSVLPNDIGIQVCGYDDGRIHSGQDFMAFAPTIIVKESDGKFVLKSEEPMWGNRDADWNSLKCGNVVKGLERDTEYIFKMHDGTEWSVKTPTTAKVYTAKCKFEGTGTINYPRTIFPCESNFGWSK